VNRFKPYIFVLHQQGFAGLKEEEMNAVMGKDDGAVSEDRLVYCLVRYSRM
jgi:hypothetical protein